jgi:hypothetical protein
MKIPNNLLKYVQPLSWISANKWIGYSKLLNTTCYSTEHNSGIVCRFLFYAPKHQVILIYFTTKQIYYNLKSRCYSSNKNKFSIEKHKKYYKVQVGKRFKVVRKEALDNLWIKLLEENIYK